MCCSVVICANNVRQIRVLLLILNNYKDGERKNEIFSFSIPPKLGVFLKIENF